MVPEDESTSLREAIVSGWKEELFSADTVVALVAVVVAIPAGFVAGAVVDPAAVFPVWFASAAGPSLGYWRGFRIEVDVRTAAVVGVGMALAIAVVTAGTLAAATTLDASAQTATAVSAVVGLLFGGLVSRLAFHRLAG